MAQQYMAAMDARRGPGQRQAVAPDMGDEYRMARLRMTFQLSRITRVFAVLDCFLALMIGLLFAPLLGLVALPLCGYHGARLYKKKYIYLYLLYIVISIVVRLYLMGSSDKDNGGFIVLLGVIIELYVMRLVQRFAQLVSVMSPEERTELLRLGGERVQGVEGVPDGRPAAGVGEGDGQPVPPV